MKRLASAGVYTGVMMMPVLPFIEDNWDNISDIVDRASDSGARFIIPGFGVTLRDRQREYYYDQLERHFPGMSDRYRRTYGNRYDCSVPGANDLCARMTGICERLGIVTSLAEVKVFDPEAGSGSRPLKDRPASQLSLFDLSEESERR